MADRTITSDLIVAADGSDEINVTVDAMRGLIKADKTFNVPAGFNIFHLFVNPELSAVSPYTANDNRPYIADDTTFSPETKVNEPSGGNITGTQLLLLNHCPELLLGKHSAERRMTYVGETANQVYEADVKNSSLYTFANLNGTDHMFICYRFYSHTDGSIHQYYLSPEIWQG